MNKPDSTGIHSTALTTPILTEYAGLPAPAKPAVALTFTFQQAGRRGRALPFEPFRKFSDLRHSLLVPQFPAGFHQRLDLLLLVFRHPIHDVP